EQYVFIQSDLKPVFDCDSLKNDPIEKVLEGVCEISAEDLKVNTPFALDACTNDTIWGEGRRLSGASMTDKYVVGRDTIIWKFVSEYSTTVDSCEQYVFIQSDLKPVFDCDSLKNDPIEKVLEGVCEISAEDLKVNTPFALDACTNDTIWGEGRRLSGASMTDKYVVGRDTIIWKFVSEYSTTVDSCEQYVFIQSDLKPVFDCDSLKDTIVYLAMNECVFDGSHLQLNIPYAKDACTNDSIEGKPSREDGKLMTDIYEKGSTTVVWTFVSEFSTTPHTCAQNVIVMDTFPPVPLCDELDTIRANITEKSRYKDVTTYEEAVAAGLVIPTVKDSCDGLITAVGVREDGTPLEGNFQIGETKIIWSYTDKSGNTAYCEQVVVVEDFGVDTLFCPGTLEGSVYACVDEIPAPYATFEEFKAAGGSYTNEAKIKPGSFRSTDVLAGDSCETTVTRIYEVQDLRGDVQSCEEVIYVKDTIAPHFIDVLRDTLISCENDVFEPIAVTASDNCDPNVKISVIEKNNRSTDPASCDYYSYDIDRIYVAMDRCGNTDTMVQHILVRDTVGPTFTYPENWRDTVLANKLKECNSEVPDFINEARSGVSDNCAETDHIKIVQVPAGGSRIGSSTTVWIYFIDMCGNTDSVSKFVKVQPAESIVNLDAFSTDTCVTDLQGVSLASQSFRFAEGYVEIVRANGTIRRVPSVFNYDYYKGSASKENLMFSDNPYTYRHLYEEYFKTQSPEKAAEALTKLTQRSESGYYTFVAMDTLTGCSDTATAYINVLERPKVKITSAEMPVCEGNVIDLAPYLQCVDSMGATITKEGWQLDGKDYDPADSITGPIAYSFNGKLASYYAENRCGSTTSFDSHMMISCSDDTLTTADSLLYLANDSIALEQLRGNKLFVHDSISLDVHQRYNPDSIFIETDPHDPARIWNGESITLVLNTPYKFHYLVWSKVVGKYDLENYNSLEGTGFEFDDPDDEEDEVYEIAGYSERPYIVDYPSDTTYYYATISDGVCPAASTGVTEVDVLQQIPTAFTPYTKDGLNDVFMERHKVVIFDRYGQKIFQGNDGWPGTTRKGAMADPAVYYYELVMGNGLIVRGTIEIVKLD
ncbi:MAG: gliding motility-associated C-terminal domain-containing protein, partial [Paludibacteraceae bacterium]|nr:gliding motility-associated C-terminal domain-containing protein [Paludibacteraceae bacterium]